MSLIFKSKLYREEILRLGLLFVLMTWGSVASVLALQNRKEVILIGLSETGPRVINNEQDQLIKSELKVFVKSFFDNYYSFDQESYLKRLSIATDMMSNDLWESQKSKIYDVYNKIKADPLSQTYQIESLDLLDENMVEAVLLIHIEQKLVKRTLRLKVSLKTDSKERDAKNPWQFQVGELSDVLL